LLGGALPVEPFGLLAGRAFGLLGRDRFAFPFALALLLLEAPGFAFTGGLGFVFAFLRLALV
jgi:hypothetical protein